MCKFSAWQHWWVKQAEQAALSRALECAAWFTGSPGYVSLAPVTLSSNSATKFIRVQCRRVYIDNPNQCML